MLFTLFVYFLYLVLTFTPPPPPPPPHYIIMVKGPLRCPSYLCAGLHVFRPVSLLADLVAVVGIPAAVVLGLLQTVATLWGQ